MKKEVLKSGIRFSHCINAAVPEIPRVQDVLFALRLTDEQDYYEFCRSNHELYNMNVHLAAAACAFEVMIMRPYDESAARKLIAQVIVDLCPEDARCVEFPAYKEAMQIAGIELPPHTDDCPRCLLFLEQEDYSLNDDLVDEAEADSCYCG
ncbi:MAG: hypothetical protein PHC53_03940 [Patescibacteria group bacterium]|nr:hypothetical protein [Patescibacteria group bacterium]